MYTGGFPTPVVRLRVGDAAGGDSASACWRRARSWRRTPASDTSSPTKRGLFTYYKLFCRPHLMPPPNVPPLDTTTRDDRHQHHARPLREAPRAGGQAARAATSSSTRSASRSSTSTRAGVTAPRRRPSTSTRRASVAAPDGSTINFTDEQDLMTAVANQPIIHECMSAYLAAYRVRQRRGVPRRQPGDRAAVRHRSASPRRSRAWPASRTSRSEAASRPSLGGWARGQHGFGERVNGGRR